MESVNDQMVEAFTGTRPVNRGVPVRFTAAPGAREPLYQTEGAAGMDLCANLDKRDDHYPFEIAPGQWRQVPTGIAIELPPEYEATVRSRSGLAMKRNVVVMHGVGTIDSDYRGEIFVPLINRGDKTFYIFDGDRIGQLVVTPFQHVTMCKVPELSDTVRGEGGLGSTGISS